MQLIVSIIESIRIITVMRFHEARFAREYQKRLSSEGYPGPLLDRVLEKINGVGTVIDVGAGTGFFTIPIAAKGIAVTAIEPSMEMSSIMERVMPKESRGNVKIINSHWEEWHGDNADALISVHSVYPMKDLSLSLRKMSRYGNRTLVIVRDETGTETLKNHIMKMLNIDKPSRYTCLEVKTSLEEMNIQYTSEIIEDSRDISFTDLNEEAEYMEYHLKTDGKITEIKDILTGTVTKQGGLYLYTSRYRDVIFTF